MTLAGQASLVDDTALQGRAAACVFGQAEIYKDDGRPDIAALARYHLKSPSLIQTIWAPFIAAAPGFADHAGDSSAITDGDLLATVQADWPTVAALWFAPDGTPVP
jgi:hypothetical protein